MTLQADRQAPRRPGNLEPSEAKRRAAGETRPAEADGALSPHLCPPALSFDYVTPVRRTAVKRAGTQRFPYKFPWCHWEPSLLPALIARGATSVNYLLITSHSYGVLPPASIRT